MSNGNKWKGSNAVERIAHLFFRQSCNIGGQSNLGLHFLFAVSEIVIGKNGDHDSTLIAACNFEWLATIVKLVRIGPAHASGLLVVGGIGNVWKTQVFLQALTKVGRQDDASSSTSPVGRIESSVVFGERGISSVSKNGFDEIKVGNASSWNKESDFQSLFGTDAGHFGTSQGTQVQ